MAKRTTKAARPSARSQFEEPTAPAENPDDDGAPAADAPADEALPQDAYDLGRGMKDVPDDGPLPEPVLPPSKPRKGFALRRLYIEPLVKGGSKRNIVVPLRLPKEEWPFNPRLERVARQREEEYDEATRDAMLRDGGFVRRDPLALNDLAEGAPPPPELLAAKGARS